MGTLEARDRGGEVNSWVGWMDRMFDEWMRSFPLGHPFGLNRPLPGDELIRVDEYRDGEAQVIRAELPGIDPAKDVEITVADGLLHINAERRVEEKTQDMGFTRHEMRYGSFTRTLPLTDGATESDITASYKDGILQIRVPVADRRPKKAPTTIPVAIG